MLLRTLLLSTSIGVAAGCTSAGAGAGQVRTAALDTPITLVAGEEVALPDKRQLRYLGVRDDSRCRPGTQCIRAGEARVDFDLFTSTGTRRLTLTYPDAPSASLGTCSLTIEALDFEAPPRVTVRVRTD